MAGDFIERSRHGTVFYFRRRVPGDIQARLGRGHIYLSLRTQERRIALMRARLLAVHTDQAFEEIRAMPRDKGPKHLRTDYGFHIDFDEASGKPKKVVFTEVKPEDESAVAALVATLAGEQARSRDAKDTPTVREAIDDLVKSGEISPRSLMEYRRMLERFASFIGEDVRLGAVTQERFAEYADHVKGQATWADKTKNSNIVTAARLFNRYAGRNSRVTGMSTKGLKFKRTRPASQDRDAFTVDELAAMFANASRYRETEPCKWWITVAPAFLGCRLEELVQAHLVGDFYKDPVTGATVLKITQDKVDPKGPSKSVKTLAGWRRVPLHPVLVEAGFVDFLEEQRALGYATPFAAQWAPFVDKKTGATVHSHSASKWGAHELKKLRKSGAVGADAKLGYFHSMRHTFVTLLTNAGITEEWRAGLAGQAYGGVNSQIYSKAREDITQTLPLIIAGLAPIAAILSDVIAKRQS